MSAEIISAHFALSGDEPHPAFVRIVADLSPLDAHVLDGLSRPLPEGSDMAKVRLDWDERGHTVGDLRKIIPSRLQAVSENSLITTGDNLDRLGLINCSYGAGNASERHGPLLMRVTLFGKSFWKVAGGQ